MFNSSDRMRIWVKADGCSITSRQIKSGVIIPKGAEIIEIPSGAYVRVKWLLERASVALFKNELFPRGEVEYWERWLFDLCFIRLSDTPEGVRVIRQIQSYNKTKRVENISFYFGGIPRKPRKRFTDNASICLRMFSVSYADPAPF